MNSVAPRLPDVSKWPAAKRSHAPPSLVTVELIGEAAAELDPELIRNAARAVLHYFKVEMGRPPSPSVNSPARWRRSCAVWPERKAGLGRTAATNQRI